MRKAVIGVVDTRSQAEAAVDALQREPSIGRQDISVVLPDTRASHEFATEHHTKAPEGALTGASAGGLLGGTLGLLAGIGALAIPGVGPLIAAGPVLATLSGAAAGAAVGGISGALVGMGITEDAARSYEGKLRSGSILIAVQSEAAETRRLARDILQRVGAHDIDTTSEASLPADARRV